MKKLALPVAAALFAATSALADEGKFETLMLSGILLVQTDTETGQLRMCRVNPELVVSREPVELTPPTCGDWSEK